MVDSVSTPINRARLQKAGPDLSQTNSPKVATSGASTTAPAGAADEVMLSSTAQQMPPGLDKAPPFDLASVSRIKQAIADGNYPIDLDSITDSLFESYRDLTA